MVPSLMEINRINGEFLATRYVLEREARVRAVAPGKPGKPWDTWADSTFTLAGNWSKIGVDHMFDHNWKIS